MLKKPKYNFKLQVVQLKDLIPFEFNPRYITEHDFHELKKNIEKFSLLDKPVVNKDMMIAGGHQRVKLLLGEGETECEAHVCTTQIPEKDYIELLLRLNRNQGNFDWDTMYNHHEDFMKEAGFADHEMKPEMDEYEEKFNAITNEEAEMPIVPKFTESYDSVIIFSENTLDMNWLINVLKLESKQDFKNNRTGLCQVITIKEFQEAWESRDVKDVEQL